MGALFFTRAEVWALPDWLLEAWDRLVASDPGWTRLRLAIAVAVSMASTLAVEYCFARITHAGAQGTVIAMLFGAMVAMNGMNALQETRAGRNARTAVFFPVAYAAGILPGVAVGGNTDLMLAVFVVVMFAAVAVRRFGRAYFFYGFMAWIGYFFASFLDASPRMVPGLMATIVVATAWVLLLSLTVLRTDPSRALRRSVEACDARGRALLRDLADLLRAQDAAKRDRVQRSLHGHGIQLNEAALMVEGWLAEPGAQLPNRPAAHLRRLLIDVQHVLDRMSTAAQELAQHGGKTAAAAVVAAAPARYAPPADS